MPGLLNPFLSFGSSGPIDLTEPWGEVARQETLSSGKLTISGLDLTGIKVVQFHISGVTVTTDDSTVSCRLIIAGSEVSSGYRYAFQARDSVATAAGQFGGSTSASEILLTATTATMGVGNASTEGFSGVVTVYNPAGALHKRCFVRSSYLTPAGNVGGIDFGGGQLNNSSAVTGFIVQGSSNLTAGTVIALGVE
jgi:hypothetical protein